MKLRDTWGPLAAGAALVVLLLGGCGGQQEVPAEPSAGRGPSSVQTQSSATVDVSGSESESVGAPSTSRVERGGDGALLLGAYVEPRGEFGDAARRQAILDHEVQIGRTLGLVNEFFAFDKDWRMDRLRWHIDSGRGLMISWNGAPADLILSGDADDVIRQRARWTRELGVPLLMRFFWEPDAAKGAEWGYREDPQRYIDVWRRVRQIFDEEGANNARWVWTPTAWHFATGNAPAYYPGDDDVDVIGADGYLWSPCQGPVESAGDVFFDFLAWAADRPQPILIAEWGADANAEAGTKAAFFDEMLELAGGVDRMLGLVVFDSVDPGGRGCDWRIDSSPSSLDAYRKLASDPVFGAPPSRIGAIVDRRSG